MRNLRFRFIAYFAVGLFIFIIYFVVMFAALTGLFDLNTALKITYEADTAGSYLSSALIFVFCFVSGGIMFSLLLVSPLSQIINAIEKLTYKDNPLIPVPLFKNGKLKLRYFMYQEVVANITALHSTLQNDALERENLDSAKNDWLAGVSHDLKTPLSYINGYATLLLNKDYSYSEEEKTAYISEIYTKGKYIEKLIDDLSVSFFLDASGIPQLKLSQIDIVSFLQNILADIANSPQAEKNIFEYHPKLERSDMMVDEGLLHRAIYNILLNCVEHNPDGVSVATELEPIQNGVCISIVDNGVGMNGETASHIMDKYFGQKNKQAKIKGLGMFVAKQIIEAHKGNISISSTLGKGTTVQISLYNGVVQSQGLYQLCSSSIKKPT